MSLTIRGGRLRRALGRGRLVPMGQDSAFERRRTTALWVAREILPHEAAVRGLLRRLRVPAQDADEIVQDCYCRFAMLDRVDHIEQPRSYFFSTARHIVGRRVRRAKIVPIDAHVAMDLFEDNAMPSPEQVTGGRLDYRRMRDFMAQLPERCRRIVELRKIEGWSQKEIAAHLGITEKAVEKQVWVGVKAIQQAWREADLAVTARLAAIEAGERR